jgi:hypothetical protein
MPLRTRRLTPYPGKRADRPEKTHGAGKSTTMRMIMGLDRPDAGQVRVGRKSYGELRWALS